MAKIPCWGGVNCQNKNVDLLMTPLESDIEEHENKVLKGINRIPFNSMNLYTLY